MAPNKPRSNRMGWINGRMRRLFRMSKPTPAVMRSTSQSSVNITTAFPALLPSSNPQIPTADSTSPPVTRTAQISMTEDTIAFDPLSKPIDKVVLINMEKWLAKNRSNNPASLSIDRDMLQSSWATIGRDITALELAAASKDPESYVQRRKDPLEPDITFYQVLRRIVPRPETLKIVMTIFRDAENLDSGAAVKNIHISKQEVAEKAANSCKVILWAYRYLVILREEAFQAAIQEDEATVWTDANITVRDHYSLLKDDNDDHYEAMTWVKYAALMAGLDFSSIQETDPDVLFHRCNIRWCDLCTDLEDMKDMSKYIPVLAQIDPFLSDDTVKQLQALSYGENLQLQPGREGSPSHLAEVVKRINHHVWRERMPKYTAI